MVGQMDDDDPTNFGSIPSYVNERMTEFQKIIPFVIGAVAIGVGTVNRTVLKSLIHLSGAILAALVAKIVANLGVTAFLFSSISYVVACCLNVNGIVDTSIKISMPIGFGILWFIDMYVTNRTSSPEFPYMPYLGTALLSAMWGVCWFYIFNKLVSNNGKAFLYDFKGCSCDDCANANTCPVGSQNPNDSTQSNSNKTVLMGRIIKQ